MNKTPCKYGTHRVISPPNALPQNAEKVDNSLPIADNEILIDVDTLNIDSASFRQMENACQGDAEKIKEMILGIVSSRGKQQNPVTGSGGMLLGSVKEIGPDYPNKLNLAVGDKIATLVSLSLTPLYIEKIIAISPEIDQVKIKGHAILFPTGVLTKIPDDLPEILALAVLDVAGAPAQTKRLVKPGETVVLIGGGGKSGSICSAVARDELGDTGTLIGIGRSDKSCNRLKDLGYCDEVLKLDACDPVTCQKEIARITKNEMADLVINCASVENTEMTSIMAAKNTGTVYFFSMATSFTKAALGAEGIGSDALLIIGNGYAAGHDKIALDTIRNHPKLKKLFEDVYV